jgi:hypothetical protein
MTTEREPRVTQGACAFRCGARAVFRYTGWYRTCLACALARRCLGLLEAVDGSAPLCGQPATSSYGRDDDVALPLCAACATKETHTCD